nr:hypothetical protein [Tanacetum cinerariifolium]
EGGSSSGEGGGCWSSGSGGGLWCGGGDSRGVVDGDGSGGWWFGRVEKSGVWDLIDRKTRAIFGFVGKRSPKNFSGGGSVVVAGRRWLPDFVGEKE